MPQILIVDGNPEHQRALGGLIRYRTESTSVITDSCVEGARIAVRDHPDVILVNVLLYVDGQFAFQRALGRSSATRDIPILVQCSGQMEELTRRRVEASGAAGVLELPVSAEELVYHIDQAAQAGSRASLTGRASDTGDGVRPVAWPQARQSADGPDTTPSDEKQQVRPVDWGAVSSGPRASVDPPARPREEQTQRNRGPGQRPASERPSTNDPPDGFRSTSFRSVDPSEAKGGGGKRNFEETQWPSVDPEKTKKPRRRRG